MSKFVLQIETIMQAYPALMILSKKEMDAKQAYRIGKLMRKMRSEVAAFEKLRNGCIVKHGLPSEQSPGSFSVPPEKMEAYQAEMAELIAEKVELDGVMPIEFSALEAMQLSPATIADLDPLLEGTPE